MSFTIKTIDEYKYIDEGKGEILLLLHGLFGALSNWDAVIRYFSKDYRVIIPMLPLDTINMKKASIPGLVDYISRFNEKLELNKNLTVIGNSLGGHLALVYTLENPQKVKRVVLTGSSGLFESGMGASFPKRGSYDYIRERVAYTFYYPQTATKELVDEVFATTKNIPKCLRIVSVAKSAQRHNMAKEITEITVPTLLVWGLNDTITPPFVAYEFNRLIPNSTMAFIDKCGHAPMMEHPERFNDIMTEFLNNSSKQAA